MLEVVNQQPLVTSPDKHKVDKISKDSSIETNQLTQDFRGKQQTEVANQTSPSKGIQPQKPVIATQESHESKTWNQPIPFLSCFNSCATDIQESGNHITTTFNEDTNISRLTITTPH